MQRLRQGERGLRLPVRPCARRAAASSRCSTRARSRRRRPSRPSGSPSRSSWAAWPSTARPATRRRTRSCRSSSASSPRWRRSTWRRCRAATTPTSPAAARASRSTARPSTRGSPIKPEDPANLFRIAIAFEERAVKFFSRAGREVRRGLAGAAALQGAGRRGARARRPAHHRVQPLEAGQAGAAVAPVGRRCAGPPARRGLYPPCIRARGAPARRTCARHSKTRRSAASRIVLARRSSASSRRSRCARERRRCAADPRKTARLGHHCAVRRDLREHCSRQTVARSPAAARIIPCDRGVLPMARRWQVACRGLRGRCARTTTAPYSRGAAGSSALFSASGGISSTSPVRFGGLRR